MQVVRISHVIAGINDEAAGPSYSVPALAKAQATLGQTVSVFSCGSGKTSVEEGVCFAGSESDFSRVPLLRSAVMSRSLRRALIDTPADIVHNHGLWLMPNIYCGNAAAARNARLVMAPRGMLGREALQYSKSTKRLVWMLAQKKVALKADCWHATSVKEFEDIRAMGLRAPVAIVPNGIDVRKRIAGGLRSGKRTLLYLGRIHPKKGLDLILDVWPKLASVFPDWQLRIVGPLDSGYSRALARRAAQLPNVSMAGQLFGGDKQRAYASADLFVLPTLGENFGMTVAEALAMGVPVVCTHGAPWAGLEKNGCGWWIGHDAHSLETALRSAMTLPDAERRDMGERGRRWMKRDFAWPAIAASMDQVYRWLISGGDRPDCVRID